ncbi:hypothetical protein Ciccas_012896 [Cichlidogyrus casuarinus]|uniref:Uncharacterized protein n=1 Tax=Cichlidogyrus casuarinus TaxID=1844966 RepID=A0ABD2PMK7_9PLAT
MEVDAHYCGDPNDDSTLEGEDDQINCSLRSREEDEADECDEPNEESTLENDDDQASQIKKWGKEIFKITDKENIGYVTRDALEVTFKNESTDKDDVAVSLIINFM